MRPLKNVIGELVATGVVFTVLGYCHHLQQRELDRHGVWMDGVNNFQAEMQKFKKLVESRTFDRWTATDQQDYEATKQNQWDALFRDNPELARPQETNATQNPNSLPTEPVVHPKQDTGREQADRRPARSSDSHDRPP